MKSTIKLILYFTLVMSMFSACQNRQPSSTQSIQTKLLKECSRFENTLGSLQKEVSHLAHQKDLERVKAYQKLWNSFHSDWYILGCRVCTLTRKEGFFKEGVSKTTQDCQTKSRAILNKMAPLKAALLKRQPTKGEAVDILMAYSSAQNLIKRITKGLYKNKKKK